MPLKHLRNFWRMLNVPLIICEVSLTLTWSKDYIILNKAKRDAAAATRISSANISGPLSEADGSATNATFKITDTKLYVVLVTLSTKDDNKLLEQLKTRFNRTIKQNKYRLEMTNQTKTNNLNYLIDPTFAKVKSICFVI